MISVGGNQKVAESIMGSCDKDEVVGLQLLKLPEQYNKSGVSSLKRSANFNKIMNYISNYWTQRTINKRCHSQVVGTQPCLIPEYPTLITQYISFTFQFLKWLDTAVRGGGGTGGSST